MRNQADQNRTTVNVRLGANFASLARRGIAVALSTFVAVLALSRFGFDASLMHRVGEPAMFSLREMLGRSPPLDPRIKILSYDEKTRVAWGLPQSLTPARWAEVFRQISRQNPKVTLFDGI